MQSSAPGSGPGNGRLLGDLVQNRDLREFLRRPVGKEDEHAAGQQVGHFPARPW